MEKENERGHSVICLDFRIRYLCFVIMEKIGPLVSIVGMHLGFKIIVLAISLFKNVILKTLRKYLGLP